MPNTPPRFLGLQRLLEKTEATTLNLTQLQALCAQADLDLYLEDSLFAWLMDQLHRMDIQLVDTQELEEPPSEADSVQEIQQDIEEIVSLQDNEEDRLLNQEETIQLLKAVKEGMAAMEKLEANPDADNRTALELLVTKKSEAEATLLTRNRGLVRRISQQYQSNLHSLTMLDLEQEGNLGFLRAIAKFDLERTTVLSTYAVYWIRQAIQQAIANQDRTIRLPVHKRNEIRLYRVAVEALRDALGREPTIRETSFKLLEAEPEHAASLERLRSEQAEPLPMDRELLFRMQNHVKQLQSYGRQYPTSLDQFMEDDEPDRHEILTDENSISPENQVLKEDLIGNVDQLVAALPEPQQTVMRLRFGFGDQKPLKYSEIAAVLNDDPDMRKLNSDRAYTGSKISQIESLARRTLVGKNKTENLVPDN